VFEVPLYSESSTPSGAIHMLVQRTPMLFLEGGFLATFRFYFMCNCTRLLLNELTPLTTNMSSRNTLAEFEGVSGQAEGAPAGFGTCFPSFPMMFVNVRSPPMSLHEPRTNVFRSQTQIVCDATETKCTPAACSIGTGRRKFLEHFRNPGTLARNPPL